MSYLLYHINPPLLHQDLQKYTSSLLQFLSRVLYTPFNEVKVSEVRHQGEVREWEVDEREHQMRVRDAKKTKEGNNADAGTENALDSSEASQDLTLPPLPEHLQQQHSHLLQKAQIIFSILYDALAHTNNLTLPFISQFFQNDKSDTFRFLRYLTEHKNDSLLERRWHLKEGHIEKVQDDIHGLEAEVAYYYITHGRLQEASQLYQKIGDAKWLQNCDWFMGKAVGNPRNMIIYHAERHEWERVLELLEQEELEPVHEVSQMIGARVQKLTPNNNADSLQYSSNSAVGVEALRYNIWLEYVQQNSQLDRTAITIMASNLVWTMLNKKRQWLKTHPTAKPADTPKISLKAEFQDEIKTQMLISEALATHCVIKLFRSVSELVRDQPRAQVMLQDIKSTILFIAENMQSTLIWALILQLNAKGTKFAILSSDETHAFGLRIEQLQKCRLFKDHLQEVLNNNLFPQSEIRAVVQSHLSEQGSSINGDHTDDGRATKKRKIGVVANMRKRLRQNHEFLASSMTNADHNSPTVLLSAIPVTQRTEVHTKFVDTCVRELIFRGQYKEAQHVCSVLTESGTMDSNHTSLTVNYILCELQQKFVDATGDHPHRESTPQKSADLGEDKMDTSDATANGNSHTATVRTTPLVDVSNELQQLASLFSTTAPRENILAEILKLLINLNAWDGIKGLFTHYRTLSLANGQTQSADICSFALRLVSVVSFVNNYALRDKNDPQSFVEEIRFFCNCLFVNKRAQTTTSVSGVQWHHVHILTSCSNTDFKRQMIAVLCYYLFSLRTVKNQPTNQFKRLASKYLFKEELYMMAVMNIFHQQDTGGDGEELPAIDGTLCDILRQLLESMKKSLGGYAPGGALTHEIDHDDPFDTYLYILTLADVHFERHSFLPAMRNYLVAASRASHHFATTVPADLLSPEVIKRMIHSLRMLRRFTESAVVCQFLSLGYDQSFISDLKTFNMKWAQYFWDESFLELLLYIAHWNNDEERENILLKLLERGDMNIHNAKERRDAFTERLKRNFFREIYRDIMTM